jgi:hypothetical protein
MQWRIRWENKYKKLIDLNAPKKNYMERIQISYILIMRKEER